MAYYNSYVRILLGRPGPLEAMLIIRTAQGGVWGVVKEQKVFQDGDEEQIVGLKKYRTFNQETALDVVLKH